MGRYAEVAGAERRQLVARAGILASVAAAVLAACDGTQTTTPKETAPGVWAQVAAGTLFTCGLTDHGLAYCWGLDESGQLGDGAANPGPGTQQTRPVAVAGGLTFTTIAAGSGHACGVTSAGAAYCWGQNASGQLGDSSLDAATGFRRTAPVAVAGGHIFVNLTAGGAHTCGLTAQGVAYCWGDDTHGQLGDGVTPENRRLFPVTVLGGLVFTSLTAGDQHTCGVTTSGVGYCWGENVWGQLGDSTFLVRDAPQPIAGGIAFGSLAAGFQHTCGVARNGAAYCWGEEYPGGLAVDRTPPLCAPFPTGPNEPCLNRPAAVIGGHTFVTLAAGNGLTCGLAANGAAFCWGYNAAGQLGNGATSPATDYQSAQPTAVAGGIAFTRLTASWQHACAVSPNGAAFCWGEGGNGQLGNGSTSNRSSPVAVVGP